MAPFRDRSHHTLILLQGVVSLPSYLQQRVGDMENNGRRVQFNAEYL